MRRQQFLKVKDLRGLNRSQARSVERLEHASVGDQLDGVDEGQGRYRRSLGGEGAINESRGYKRARRIMHKHFVGMIRSHRLKSGRDRALPGRFSGHRFEHGEPANGGPVMRKVIEVDDRLH